MYGKIDSYDSETQTGTISVGKEVFKFDSSIWVAEAPPETDDIVRFDLNSDGITNVTLAGAFLDKEKAVKRRWLAALLSFLLGWAGIGRLYLGYYKIAIFQMLYTGILLAVGFVNFAFLWGFIDALLLMTGHFDRDAQNRPLK